MRLPYRNVELLDRDCVFRRYTNLADEIVEEGALGRRCRDTDVDRLRQCRPIWGRERSNMTRKRNERDQRRPASNMIIHKTKLMVQLLMYKRMRAGTLDAGFGFCEGSSRLNGQASNWHLRIFRAMRKGTCPIGAATRRRMVPGFPDLAGGLPWC